MGRDALRVAAMGLTTRMPQRGGARHNGCGGAAAGATGPPGSEALKERQALKERGAGTRPPADPLRPAGGAEAWGRQGRRARAPRGPVIVE